MRKSIGALAAAILTSIIFSTNALAAGYTETRHPIVLVHGVTGFSTIGGLINYFHNIPWNLERSGARVETVSVSFVNSSWQRGEQLRNYLNALGPGKYNLFALSQGAPTSRVAAALAPWKVASITSINGVNKGSKVADVIRGIIPPCGHIEGGVDALARALGDLVNAFSNSNCPQDGVAALESLTTPGTTNLNNALVDSTGQCNIMHTGNYRGLQNATVSSTGHCPVLAAESSVEEPFRRGSYPG